MVNPLNGPDSNAAAKQQADQGWDTYQERVLRNEGRLEGLEQLVKETRASDAKLIEQRSESLAKELRDTAESLQRLMSEQRHADRDGIEAELKAAKELVTAYRTEDEKGRIEAAQLVRDVLDLAIQKNYEQSHSEIFAMNERVTACISKLEDQVAIWRETDREARELQAMEYARRLDALNHAHERQQEFMAHSVTRELWQASEDTWNAREKADHDKMAALELALLGMTPLASSERAHEAIHSRIEDMGNRLTKASDERLHTINEKISDLKSWQAANQGRSTGYANLYGWMIAAVGIIISMIIVINVVTSK